MPQNLLPGGADAVRSLNRLTLRILGLVGRVRPDERREAAGATLVLFGFMTGHALLETARDALFLSALPVRRLPWIYLTIAVLALAVGRNEPGSAGRLSGRNPLRGWLLTAGGVTLAFWAVAGTGWRWVYSALYIWSGVLASLVVVRFWTVLGGRFTLTQAKRIFAVIASGSVAGAIAGSALAAALTQFVGPRHLVFVAGLVFLATSAAPLSGATSVTSARSRGDEEGLGRVARLIWSGPYLRRVAALLLLATVTFTLVDYVFKSAAGRLVAPQDLGAFFANVYLSVNILSLLAQVVAVPWLLRRVGLVSVVATVPALLLLSTVGFTVVGGLGMALVLKGADGTLRHSLYRTGAELLFLPLSDRLRTQVKGIIDVLGQRGGQALASVLILMVLSTTGMESVFAGLACLTSAAWLVVAVGLREPYLDLFRETLYGEGHTQERRDPELDMASLETLLAALNASDDRRVMAALDVLTDQGKLDVVPGLLLYHPSPPVVIRALDAFALGGREDALPMVTRLLSHAQGDVRAAAVRALALLGPDQESMTVAAAEADPAVAVTARAMLLAAGWATDGGNALSTLRGAVHGEDLRVTRALARALRFQPVPALEPLLPGLLQHEDTAVLGEAIRAARHLRTPALVSPLVLALGRRAVREEARLALAAYGAAGIAPLSEALEDRAIPSNVRRHIPGALALMGSAQVPAILLKHLQEETDGMIRFKVLRALGRWRREQPHLPLDLGLLQEALGQALSTGFRLMGWRHRLEGVATLAPALRTELHVILAALLRDKQDHALERVFRLLNLQAGTEEFHRLYRGVHSANPSVRAGSRELLQHMIVPPVRGALMTLVDDLHGEAPRQRVERQDPTGGHQEYARVLSELIGCGMESASSLAGAHAAELGLTAVLPALASATPLSRDHEQTLARAGDQLGKEVA